MKINDEKLLEKIGFKPHEGQKKVLEAVQNEKVRDITLSAGRRFGKSLFCAYIALRTILIPNKRVWIVAPTYDLTQKVFTYLLQFIGKIFEHGSYKIQTRPFPKLTLPNGSWVECKSTENPNGLLGEEVDLLIVDEAAMTPPNIYERYLFPVTTSRRGRTIFISTPFGKNWFYLKYVECTEKEDGASFNFPSNTNPEFPKEEWERARKMLPEKVFKQEHLATFLDDAASVFRGIREIIADTYEQPVPTHRYVLGVDLAKLEDFTVLTVIDRNSHRVVAWDRFNKIDYPLQKKRIAEMAKKYNNARIIIDSTGVGSPITDDLRREGVSIDDFKFTNKSKEELIDKLSIFIEQKGVWIPNESTLINELDSFGYQLTDSGNIKYSAPVGQHDDAVMSLGLAVWGLYSTSTIKDKKEEPTNIFLEELRPKIKKVHR